MPTQAASATAQGILIMKITHIEAIHLRLPEVNERCDGSQETLVVKVHTDAGISGVGEVDSSALVAKAIIEAMSGIEIALWDIAGKASGQPVYKLLGGGFRKKFRAYASILFGDSPAETERIGRSLVTQGYRAVKFGWGPMGQSETSDIAPVRAARQGLGPNVELMVDAGL